MSLSRDDRSLVLGLSIGVPAAAVVVIIIVAVVVVNRMGNKKKNFNAKASATAESIALLSSVSTA